jgi:hypothetical protein
MTAQADPSLLGRPRSPTSPFSRRRFASPLIGKPLYGDERKGDIPALEHPVHADTCRKLDRYRAGREVLTQGARPSRPRQCPEWCASR